MPKKPVAKPKPSTKAKPAKRAASAPSQPMSVDRKDESMQIRKISNGYVVRESWVEGSGPSAKYHERETFTKQKPQIVLPK